MKETDFVRRKIDSNLLPQVIKYKWSPAVLDEGFVPFPKRLLRCLHTLFSDKNAIDFLRVILAIVDYRRPNMRLPSPAYLAFNAGMPTEKFEKLVMELEKKGLLTSESTENEIAVELDGLLEEIEKQTSEKTDKKRKSGHK